MGRLPNANVAIDAVYRSDWSRIVATLIRLSGDFDIAEEAAQEAFAAAVGQWPVSGVPEFPRAWIIQTARHKALDRLRRRTRFEEKLASYAASGLIPTSEEPDYDPSDIPDDRLRLIFTCCHPALGLEAQVALTLHDARREARLDAAGDLVLLEEQDRRRWDHQQIAEALQGGPGPFALQAAIAALHCQAAHAEDTDWPQIVRLCRARSSAWCACCQASSRCPARRQPSLSHAT